MIIYEVFAETDFKYPNTESLGVYRYEADAKLRASNHYYLEIEHPKKEILIWKKCCNKLRTQDLDFISYYIEEKEVR